MRDHANDDGPPGGARVIPAAQIEAYVAGELGARQKSEIEGFLSCNPDLAAWVMRAMHLKSRNGAAPRRKARGVALRAALVTAACMACGMLGVSLAGTPASPEPEYVQEAVESRRATLVRVAMRSQPETPALDAAEIRRMMNLRLPVLPAGWRVLDVQVYPTDDGPSVSLLVETEEGRRLSLFAVRADTAVSRTPVVTSRDGAYVAYWEVGEAAYALSGEAPRAVVAAGAALLSRSKLL